MAYMYNALKTLHYYDTHHANIVFTALLRAYNWSINHLFIIFYTIDSEKTFQCKSEYRSLN